MKHELLTQVEDLKQKVETTDKAGSLRNGDKWYFAYGSNLDKFQKIDRTGPILEARNALLKDYRLAFNKCGNNGNIYANIIPEPTDAGSEPAVLGFWIGLSILDFYVLDGDDIACSVPDS